jgi:DNA-directed RNA polymerase specialized sigma24 family protein
MGMARDSETEFQAVFTHLGAVTAYARRRGSLDADGLAAEVMTIAWRRLEDVPKDDPRPWLYGTARNLLFAEARRTARDRAAAPIPELVAEALAPHGLDPELANALRLLSSSDLEALFSLRGKT